MTFLDYCQAFALIAGGLAGSTTFVIAGLPIIGRYPGKLRHSLNDLFTGDLQGKVAEQTSELRDEISRTAANNTQAIHEQTVLMHDNHEEAMARVNTIDQRLHAHESNLALHRKEAEE